MRRLNLIVLLLCAGAFVGCQGKADPEKPSGLKNMAPPPIQEEVQQGLDVEPNDTFLQATEIVLTGDAVQWEGSLGTGDTDVWQIKAKAGTVAEITVTPHDAVDLIVDYAQGAEQSDRVYYDVHPSGIAEVLPNIRLTPQGGYLTITRRSAGGEESHYRVQVQRLLADQEQTLESEPNDSAAQALSLKTTSVKGILYPSGDVDYYRMHLDEPGAISFTLPDAALEVSADVGERHWEIVSRQAQSIQSEVFASGTDLIIAVKSLEQVREPQSYAFHFIPSKELPDEVEPNDTVEQAQVLSGNIRALHFDLGSASDVDIFRISPQPERINRMRLVGPGDGQAILELIDPSGNVRTDAAGDSRVICDIRSESDLYMKVRSGSAPNVVFPLGYQIEVESEEASGMELEPNQTREQAMILEPGTGTRGHIFPAGDVDNYRIVIPEQPGQTGVAGELSIEVKGGYGSMLQLKLQDSAGYEVSQAKNAKRSSPIKMSLDVPAGEYNLEVSGEGDNCQKVYELGVSFKAAEIPAVPEVGGGDQVQAGTEAGTVEQPNPVNPEELLVDRKSGEPTSEPVKELDEDVADLIRAAQQEIPSKAEEKPAEDEDAF